MKISGLFCPLILFSLIINGLTGDVSIGPNALQSGETHQCGWRRYSKIVKMTLDDEGGNDVMRATPRKRASFNETGPESVISMVFYGDQLADRTQDPWVVRILKTIIDPMTNATSVTGATGFIVGRQWIMTAAHVVFNITTWKPQKPSQFRIIIAHNTTIPTLDINISEIIVHEDIMLANNMLWYDIALLKLVHPLNYTPEVQPVCLPMIFSESDKCTNLSSTKQELASEKARAEVVGYGTTETTLPRISLNDSRWPVEIARRGLMRFMCPEFFLQLFPQSATNDSGPTWTKYHRLCLYNIDTSREPMISNGDSGGPAVRCPLTDKTGTMERCFSLGLLSAGGRPITTMPEFNGTDGPAEYMRVSLYCDWIANKTEGQVRCERPFGEERDESDNVPNWPLPPPLLPGNDNITDLLKKLSMPKHKNDAKENFGAQPSHEIKDSELHQ